jgi:hypothetical protein
MCSRRSDSDLISAPGVATVTDGGMKGGTAVITIDVPIGAATTFANLGEAVSNHADLFTARILLLRRAGSGVILRPSDQVVLQQSANVG